MINLLPEQQKKAIRREYRLRVFVVFLVGFILLICIGIVALVPSYGLAVYKNTTAEALAGKSMDTTAEKEEYASMMKTFATVKTTVAALSEKEEKMTPMTITALLVQHKTLNNRITGITYTKEKEGFKVDVRGVAKDRQSLQTFTNELRKESGIVSVDVPVSNFAQDSNIDFAFVIHGKQ